MEKRKYSKRGLPTRTSPTLPEIKAQALELFFGCGKSTKEIAHITGKSENHVARILDLGFKKRLSETTETITLKSKV